jgi:hypothetical protein
MEEFNRRLQACALVLQASDQAAQVTMRRSYREDINALLEQACVVLEDAACAASHAAAMNAWLRVLNLQACLHPQTALRACRAVAKLVAQLPATCTARGNKDHATCELPLALLGRLAEWCRGRFLRHDALDEACWTKLAGRCGARKAPWCTVLALGALNSCLVSARRVETGWPWPTLISNVITLLQHTRSDSARDEAASLLETCSRLPQRGFDIFARTEKLLPTDFIAFQLFPAAYTAFRAPDCFDVWTLVAECERRGRRQAVAALVLAAAFDPVHVRAAINTLLEHDPRVAAEVLAFVQTLPGFDRPAKTNLLLTAHEIAVQAKPNVVLAQAPVSKQ